MPGEFGGAGALIEDVAAAVYELSRRGANTKIWCSRCTRFRWPASYGTPLASAWFAAYLRRIAREQRLIASATSEVGTGGDIRRSIAAIQPEDGVVRGAALRFEKKATTVSYGAMRTTC